MLVKLAGFAVFSLIILMIIPVYADVDVVKINPETFTIDDKFTISGTISDAEKTLLTAVIRGSNGEKPDNKNTFSSNGEFSFIPIDAKNVFVSKGEYTIKVFTDKEDFASAEAIKVFYEKGIVTLLPDYILELKEIGNKSVNETEKLSFTASVTDSTIEILEYSIGKNPNGATINKDTGVFSWTPTDAQSGNYILDIIVKSGPLEERETITITVNDKPKPTVEPEIVCPQGLEPVNGKCTDKSVIESTKELGIASFVDESKDPQSYVDRYNNEATYKKWFDDNYSQYSSIHQAVGLDEHLEIPAAFVDESKDPQSYVDRYNNEATYKKWFDDNYSQYSSIHQAVGLGNQGSVVEEPEFGECGDGTRLSDGVCTIIEKIIVKPWWQFW